MREAPRLGHVVVYVRDGQVIDVSGLTPAAAIALLVRRGVTPENIVRTVHVVSPRATKEG